MNMRSSAMKSRSATAALGSVRAEGLSPTKKTQTRVKHYVDGKITKRELRRVVIAEMRTQNAR